MSLCHQNLFQLFNSNTYMTFDKNYHSNLIQNGLCPCYFYNIDLLKLVFYVNTSIFSIFWTMDKFIFDNKVFRDVKICIRILLGGNTLQIKSLHLVYFSMQVTYWSTSQQIDSLCVRLSFGTRSPKKSIILNYSKLISMGALLKSQTFLNP